MKEFVDLYFWGSVNACEIVKKPVGRYLCTVSSFPHQFSYDIYDPELEGEPFACIKNLRF